MKGKPQTISRAMAVGAIFTAIVLGLGPPCAQAQDRPGQPSYPALVSEVNELQQQVAALQNALAAVQANKALALGDYVTVDPNGENGLKGPRIIFHDANVQIESGSGSTTDDTGLGNLAIGYDEDSSTTNAVCPIASEIDRDRTGSHNLIVGECQRFTASGGLVAGLSNTIGGEFASVSGGIFNTADGDYSSVSGGAANAASGEESSVSGGESNEARGPGSSVSGGVSGKANGPNDSISGGDLNTASGYDSSISGGRENAASGTDSSILGGHGVSVTGTYETSP